MNAVLSEKNAVLKALKDFPANTIYFIGPKEFFLRGYEYYRNDRLTAYHWLHNHSVLRALVQGTRAYSVDFTAEDGKLSSSCDCPAWTATSHCKHVICALLTTINLLSPTLFKLPEHHNRAENHSLAFGLLGKQDGQKRGEGKRKKADLFELVIEDMGLYPFVCIRKNGEILHSPLGVPPELAFFITYNFYSASFLRENLLRYLNKFGNTSPLVFKTKAVEIPLEWDPTLEYQGKTELMVSGNYVEIRGLCLINAKACERAHRIWDFVADLGTKKLGMVKDTRGWNLYHYLEKLFLSEDDALEKEGTLPVSDIPVREPAEGSRTNMFFRVPLRRFQSTQIIISNGVMDTTLRTLVLKVDGKEVSPNATKPSYRLTIHPRTEGGKDVVLQAECWVEGSSGMTTAPTFDFFTFIENASQFSAALRAQKRKRVLLEAFFRLLSVRKKTEADRIIKESLSGGDFSRYRVRAYAKKILRHFWFLYLEPDARLCFHGGKWYTAANEKAKEALLYQIPFELFGPEIFKGMLRHDTMVMTAEIFYGGFALLYSRLKDKGVALFYKNKSVVTARWEFSFDARRTSGIDWFEVRPEIRSEGVRVDQGVWRAAQGRGGIVETEDLIQILDANSQEVLKFLSAISTKDTLPKDNKKEIVRVPRLQILDWIYLRQQGVKIKFSEEDEALIQGLTHFDQIGKTPLPKKLKAKLRPYQQEGYEWLAFLYRHRFGACLADDMGLGKTLQAICLLGGIKEGMIVPSSEKFHGPHLVVLPPSLLFNWEGEIARFYKHLKIYSYTGKERNTDFKDCDLVLTTYGLVRRDIEKLKKISFHVIIFDEAQAIKNIYADTTGAVRQLKGYFKMVMTGTPLENHLGEYYSLVDLCLPGLLGEYDYFKSQLNAEKSPLIDVLLRRTKPFVMRRTKERVLKELPPKTETDIYLNLTPRQKTLYQQTVEQVKSTINNAYKSKTHAQAQIIALTAILKLRQLCISPRLLTKEVSEHSPKIEFLVIQLKELLSAGHSALVFSQFTSFLDILEDAFKDGQIPFSRLDGSTATQKRKKLVEGFQMGASPSVFLLSLKAGGQGLNLTKASYVFHLDPWWNPAVENQASDRAHRIGQKNKVSITRILMHHTIEEKMMELKKKKLALYKAVMEEATKGGKSFSITKSDFDFLLGA